MSLKNKIQIDIKDVIDDPIEIYRDGDHSSDNSSDDSSSPPSSPPSSTIIHYDHNDEFDDLKPKKRGRPTMTDEAKRERKRKYMQEYSKKRYNDDPLYRAKQQTKALNYYNTHKRRLFD